MTGARQYAPGVEIGENTDIVGPNPKLKVFYGLYCMGEGSVHKDLSAESWDHLHLIPQGFLRPQNPVRYNSLYHHVANEEVHQ
jgi:hypothetical protein